MKRTFSNVFSLKFTCISLLMSGLFALLPTQAVEAQVSQVNVSNSIPAGPYVDAATAQTRIADHIDFIKPQMEFLAPNTAAYRRLDAKISFFFSILETLKSGKTVQESIQAGLGILKSDAYAPYEKSYLPEFRQEAIDILTP